MKDNVCALNVFRLIEGVRIGKIVNIDENGRVFVSFPDNPHGALSARLTSSVNSKIARVSDPVGLEVLIAFESEDSNLPIIIDTMWLEKEEDAQSAKPVINAEATKDVLVDGERITFDAGKEIVLRCGKSSITLTKAGKVLIRGADMLIQSYGENRIKGGSIKFN